MGKKKNASSKEENELVLPDSLVSKIKEANYGKLFMMFWDTNYTHSHWEKLYDALTKMIKCYRWVEDDDVIQFEFERNGKVHVLKYTPEEVGLILGLPRLVSYLFEIIDRKCNTGSS